MVVQNIFDTMCAAMCAQTCGDIGQCADTDAEMMDDSSSSRDRRRDDPRQQQRQRQSAGGSSRRSSSSGGGGGGGGVAEEIIGKISSSSGGIISPAFMGKIRGNNNWDSIFQTTGSGGNLFQTGNGGRAEKRAKSAAAADDSNGNGAPGVPLLKGSSDLSKSGEDGEQQQPNGQTASAFLPGLAVRTSAFPTPSTPPASNTKAYCGFDMENAEAALAQARQEANAHARAALSRRSRSSSSRGSRSGKRKADIFRKHPKPMTSTTTTTTTTTTAPDDANVPVQVQNQTKSAGADENGRVASPIPTGGFCAPTLNGIAEDVEGEAAATAQAQGGGGQSSFLTPFLCFANPIRDSASDEGLNNSPPIREVHDDEMTYDTYGEETITSTLYFDNKFGEIIESRPPMPLYRSFQVVCTEKKTDDLIEIVKSESHRSLSHRNFGVVTVDTKATRKITKKTTTSIVNSAAKVEATTRKQQATTSRNLRDDTPLARNGEGRSSPDRSECSSVPPPPDAAVPPPPPMAMLAAAAPPTGIHKPAVTAIPLRHRMLVENFEVQNLSSDGYSSSSSESESSAFSAPHDEARVQAMVVSPTTPPTTPTGSGEGEASAAEVTPPQVTPEGATGSGGSSSSRNKRQRYQRRINRSGASSSVNKNDDGRGPAVPELLQTPPNAYGTTAGQQTADDRDVPMPTAVTPERTTPTGETEASSIEVEA